MRRKDHSSSFSMNLSESWGTLEAIQKLLGHSSLQSTGIYLEPSGDDLLEAVEMLAA